MKTDLSTVAFAFPKGLMSTARSSLTMPATFAREIKNMLMAADGAGAKRNGVVKVGSAIGGEVIVAVMGYQATVFQLLVVTNAGKIYKQNEASWTLQYSGLNVTGTVRTVTFGGRLVLCNGIDEVMAYDGTTWSKIAKFVVDAASGLTYLSATQFRIDSDAALYAVGSRVRAKLGSAYVEADVSAVSVSGVQVTVTLGSSVLTNLLNQVAYTVKPPKVAFLAVAHDRLWGFGKGPLSVVASSDVDRLRVFYTDGVNDHTAWPDSTTGIIPSINLADKAGLADELLAMAVKDNMTVFMGRGHVQIWTGSDPTVGGDLAWSKTIPLGVVHGNAVLELPNDLLFVTRQGVRTLSRTVQTEQLDISDVGGELDPTVAEVMSHVLADDSVYRRLIGVRCDEQGWLGLALNDRTLVWQIGAFGSGWVVFDGAFSALSAAFTAPDGTLYLGKGGQLYRYDMTVWSDDGGDITTLWWVPWVSPGKGKRWANKYTEALVAPGSEMSFSLRRYRDYDDANPQVLGMVAPAAPDYWDGAEWDEALWDVGEATSPIARDHVVADTYGFAIESVGAEGPFTLFGIKLYGVAER